jgi:hypothetical protein
MKHIFEIVVQIFRDLLNKKRQGNNRNKVQNVLEAFNLEKE